MQIILLQDVKSVGKKGEIVKISDGYARNFIIPRKMGVEATPKNLNDLKVMKEQEEKRQRELLAQAKEDGAKIAASKVQLSIRMGEGGRSFGSVSTKEIADAAKKQCGLEIDKKKMVLQDPIKAPGIYRIPVKLHPEVTSELVVQVSEA